MAYSTKVVTLATRPLRERTQRHIDDLLQKYGINPELAEIRGLRAEAPQRIANGDYTLDDIARDLNPELGVKRSGGVLLVTTDATTALWPRTIVLHHMPDLYDRFNRIAIDDAGTHLLREDERLVTIQRVSLQPDGWIGQYRHCRWLLTQLTHTDFDWRSLQGRTTLDVRWTEDDEQMRWQLTPLLRLVVSN